MSYRILIADDESDIVSMLGSFFESKGFRVLPASNGEEALKQVEKQPDIFCLTSICPGQMVWRSVSVFGITYPAQSFF